GKEEVSWTQGPLAGGGMRSRRLPGVNGLTAERASARGWRVAEIAESRKGNEGKADKKLGVSKPGSGRRRHGSVHPADGLGGGDRVVLRGAERKLCRHGAGQDASQVVPGFLHGSVVGA